MRVIVTGGTGLIGQALVASLHHDGHEVIVLGRNPNKTSGLPRGVKVTPWDGKTANGWGHLADGAGAIVNLAGASIAGEGFLPERWSSEKRAAIKDSRLNAGAVVMAAVASAKTKPGVLIQSSAVGYYGVHGDENLTEASPAGDDFLAEVTKAWEDSTKGVEDHGVRRAIIRTGVVLSRDGGALPRMALPFKLFAGGYFGDGQQQMSWIHIDDEIGAIRFLIDHADARGPFNLTAPNPVTNKQLAKVLGESMKRPMIAPVPGFAMKAAFGDVTTVVLDGQRVIPQRLLELGYQFKYTTIQQALTAIYGRTMVKQESHAAHH